MTKDTVQPAAPSRGLTVPGGHCSQGPPIEYIPAGQYCLQSQIKQIVKRGYKIKS